MHKYMQKTIRIVYITVYNAYCIIRKGVTYLKLPFPVICHNNQTKAREDGLHENFSYYNFAYRTDMKTPVVSYRTKWPTGWKSEWFYVKIDEKKEKLVQSPLSLTFGETRPQCVMSPDSLCQIALGEFRVVAEILAPGIWSKNS